MLETAQVSIEAPPAMFSSFKWLPCTGLRACCRWRRNWEWWTSGHLVTTIHGSYPRPRGVLFDLPHVVPNATARIRARDLTERVTIEAGGFFESVPAGGDGYLLSHVIRDWTKNQCLTILGNWRRAMKPDARLLMIEVVVPEDDTPHLGKMLDMRGICQSLKPDD